MEEVQIKEGRKGMVLYAKFTPQENVLYGSDWIVIVHSVSKYYSTDWYAIKRIVSYCLADGHIFWDNPPGNWGNSKNYTFYKATDKQKKMVISALRKHNKKYVSILGKVVDL